MTKTLTATTLTFDRAAMLDALAAVATVIPTRSPKPILQSVKLVAEPDGTAELLATDLELGIRHRVLGVNVDAPIEVILPPARFRAILAGADDTEITLTIGERVMVRGKGWHVQLTAEDPSLYPDVPPFAAADYHVIHASALRTLVRRTLYAADAESTRYALGGCLVEAAPETLTLVATDGRRLAKQTFPAEIIGAGFPATPPPVVSVKAWKLIDRLLTDDDAMVYLAIVGYSIQVRTEEASIYARLVEGRFPRYADVFPSEVAEYVATIEAGAILDACTRVAITTSEESRGVDFAFAAGILTLTSSAADIGAAETVLEIATLTETDVAVSLDARYVIETMKSLPRDCVVRWSIIGPKHPLVLTTTDGLSVVLMPLTTDR